MENKKEDGKIYSRIYHLSDIDRLCLNIQWGEKVTVEEKLDGSNLAIILEWNEEKNTYDIKLRSRTASIDKDNVKPWGAFVDLVDKKVKPNLNEIRTQFGADKVTIFGEFLKMGRIKYNKELMNTFHVFDVRLEEFEFVDRVDFEGFIKHYLELSVVPIIETNLTMKELIREKKVEDLIRGLSLIDNNVNREGVVVKTYGKEQYRIMFKFVTPEFKEERRVKLEKEPKITIDDVNPFTFNRVEKYIRRLIEEGLIEEGSNLNLPENKKTIFINRQRLTDDLLEEEDTKLDTSSLSKCTQRIIVRYLKEKNNE